MKSNVVDSQWPMVDSQWSIVNGRWPGLLLIVVYSLWSMVYGLGTALAKDVENPKDQAMREAFMEIETRGKAQFRVYQDTYEDNQFEKNEDIDSRVRIENKIIFNDFKAFIQLNAEARYQILIGDDSNRDFDLLLREAYAQIERDNFNFSLGRQTITWGKLDDVIVLDRISPQDYERSILYDKQERKLPVFMARHEYFGDNFQLEGIFIPFFKADNLKFFGSDWAVYDHLLEGVISSSEYNAATKSVIRRIKIEETDDNTERDLKNSQFAVRLRSKLEELDYGVYYMHIRNSAPMLRERTANGNTLKQFLNVPNTGNLASLVGLGPTDEDLTLEREHPKMNVIGLDAETIAGEFGLRTEMGLFLGMPYLKDNYSYIRKDTLITGLGIDHTTADNLYLNLQLLNNYILDYEALFPDEECATLATLNLNKSLLRGQLILDLDSSFSFSYHDWMLNPAVTYKFKNGFNTTFGGYVFEGGPTTVNGKFTKNDLIYLELLYQF